MLVALPASSRSVTNTVTQAAFLLTIRSTSNLIVSIVLLPAISTFCLVKLKMDATFKDIMLARISGVILVIGSFLMAFAFTPWILSVGESCHSERAMQEPTAHNVL